MRIITPHNNDKMPFILLDENSSPRLTHIHVFRTGIKTMENVNNISPVMNSHPKIESWSVDTEDIDNVLRIVAHGKLNEAEIIKQLRKCGFFCEVLHDQINSKK